MDIEKIRQDFPMLQGKTMQGKPLIYLDNGATTFKPKPVIDEIVAYLSDYTANAHRGDYDLSYVVDTKYEQVRADVAKLINAPNPKEIVFTYGATDSLNLIAEGYQLVTVSEMYEARGETLDPGTIHYRTDPTTEVSAETTAAGDEDGAASGTTAAGTSASTTAATE